ncbi:MAG: hypothetical protein ACKO0Z_07605 [Betaproteobacteria bacterium]
MKFQPYRTVHYENKIPENERLTPEVQGVNAFGPFSAYNAGSRNNMFAHQSNQHLVVSGMSLPSWTTGYESALAETSFMIKVPRDGVLREIIPLYSGFQNSDGAISKSPETLLIFEATGLPGDFFCVQLYAASTRHKKFGFIYAQTPECKAMSIGKEFKAGTILAHSPGVIDGQYTSGIGHANMVCLTDAGSSEDAIIMLDEFLYKHTYYTHQTVRGEYGSGCILLNLHGDENTYRGIPDIGQEVGKDGILMAIRTLDYPGLAPVLYSKKALREVNEITDKVYRVKPGSVVVDVRVHCSARTTAVNELVEGQLLYYNRAETQFHQRVANWYRSARQRYTAGIKMDPDLIGYVKTAIQLTSANTRSRVQHAYKGIATDTYVVEVTTAAIDVPWIGSKWTGYHGNKGVTCEIRKREEMYRDELGNVADMVMCTTSTFNRNIAGSPLEHYISTSGRDARTRMCAMLGITQGISQRSARQLLLKKPEELVQQAARYIWDYWQHTSPRFIDKYMSGELEFDPVEIVSFYIENPIGYDASSLNYTDTRVVQRLSEDPRLAAHIGHLTYKNMVTGEMEVTENKIMIADAAVMVLEKVGDQNSATGSTVVGPTGSASRGGMDVDVVPASGARAIGEDEGRAVTANTPKMIYNDNGQLTEIIHDGEILGKLFRINAVHALQLEAVRTILTAEYPTAIPKIIPDELYASCRSHPSNLLESILLMGGFRIGRNQ